MPSVSSPVIAQRGRRARPPARHTRRLTGIRKRFWRGSKPRFSKKAEGTSHETSVGLWCRGVHRQPLGEALENGRLLGARRGYQAARILFVAADEFRILDLRESGDCEQALHLSGDSQPFDEVYQLAADMGGMGFIHSAESDIMRNNALDQH